MTIPGPWVQPPDVLRLATRTVMGFNQPYTSSHAATQQPTFDEVVSSSSAFVTDEAANPSISTGVDHESEASVAGDVTLIRFELQFVNRMPTPPTPTELATPHVVGYEYEGGSEALSVIVGPYIARSWLSTLTGDFNFTFLVTPPIGEPVAYSIHEMLEGTDYTLSPVVVGGITFQQVHAVIYPNSAVLGGRLEVAYNNTGVVPTEENQNELTGVSWEVPSSLPAYAFAAHNLTDAIDIVGADRSADPASVSYSPHVDFSAWVRPPRYRLLYDIASPQRQFPRDDGMAMSTKRSWPPPTSRQHSLRKGPVGTFL